MSQTRDDTAWLQRGRQRAAVARVLRKPMTGTEICAAARVFNSHIQLRDVWHLLRQMERRGLVQCYNPRLVTGRLYLLTPRGRAAIQKAFAISVSKPPSNIDWRKYSQVARAKIRRLTLISLGRLEEKTGRPRQPRPFETSGTFHALEPRHPCDQGFVEVGFISNGGRDRGTTVETLPVDPDGN